MGAQDEVSAVVVGAGPNGLAAAIVLARAGRRVRLIERAPTVGGGCRSAELTLPGFVHDVCSAFHPAAAASPFLRGLGLDGLGVELVQPDAPLAHPLDDGSAVVLERSVDATAAGLGPAAAAYRRLFAPAVRSIEAVAEDYLGPVLKLPRHPASFARFGLRAIRSAASLAEGLRDERAKALVAGLCGHSMLPLDRPVTGGVGLLLGALGHAVGWPIVRGGSQRLADALAGRLRILGGEIETGRHVASLDELADDGTVLLDVTPRAFVAMAGGRLPAAAARRYRRFRYGPGVFKADYALAEPVPWKSPDCLRAGTVHVGGSFAEIAAGEADVWRGRHPERPLVLVGQQSLFDPSRAPTGRHTLWAYCHVPSGSTLDMTERIEAQIERFAPGFRDVVLARSTRTAAELGADNPNYEGGDINGGVQDLVQTFARPVPSLRPYGTPVRGVFLCSSSTPPGGGVHGMCGYHAARAALRAT